MNYNEIDMNLIKTFCTVCECKSILLASKKLFVSQPAITKSIKRLEEYLGGKLFIRTPKGVEKTTEGEVFYNYCLQAIKNIENGISKFKTLTTFEKGFIHIGSSSTIMRKILLPFIKHFNTMYPNIVITVTDADSKRLLNLTKSGEIDLCILNMPIDNEELFSLTKIMQTTDCFIASKSFEKDFLTKEEIKQYPLILQKKPSSNRDAFEKMCLDNSVNYSPSFEVGSFGLITDFVANDMGIAYTVTNFITDDVKNNRIKIIDTNLNIKPRDICAVIPKFSTSTLVCLEFIKQLQIYFKK